MAWPTLQDYNEAIQNPQTAFNDQELKAGKAEIDKLGLRLPRVRTGQFACVYRMQCAKRDWAIRCFSQEIKDQQQRYKAIDDYISPLKIPHIVEFDYLPKGILVKGQWYPILRMEWVQGELISEYVEHNLNNPSALRQLAVRWVEMLKVLQADSIAHGDLQHGNVLVVGDTLKLVDYDGMFVPSFQGQLSHEIGHRNYQHPNRKETDFGLYLDNFSAWVIYVSLVALSIDPSLWAQVKAGDECLLFRKADFDQPLLSTTLSLLIKHRDPNIRMLATLFRSMPFFLPDQVPSLDGQVPLDIQTGAHPTGWWSDHEASDAQSKVEPKTMSHDRASATAASWILDFVNPPENTKEQFFRQSFAIPRLFAIFSGIISVTFLGVVVPFVSSSTPAGDSVYLDLLILYIRALTFGFFGYLNIMALVWCYLREPSAIQKRELSSREKKARALLASLEMAVASNERKKSDLKINEDKQRRDLDNALKRLQEQERKEIDGVQTVHKKIIVTIDSRRQIIDLEEREALAKLIATVGYRVNSLKLQIDALAKSEADEIAKELTTIQNRYKEDYLKRHPVAEAPLAGLRYASRSSLESALLAHGIFTANDVSYARVDAVPGFGPKRTQILVNWRSRLVHEATMLMPSDLNPGMKDTIRARYAGQKQSLGGQRDTEQAKFSTEDKAIRDRYQISRRTLENEQSAAQAQATQKIQEISKRFAQEYLQPTQALSQLVAEFNLKHQEGDKQIKKIRQEMFGVSWQIAKIQHEYMAYRNISFLQYLRLVFLSYGA